MPAFFASTKCLASKRRRTALSGSCWRKADERGPNLGSLIAFNAEKYLYTQATKFLEMPLQLARIEELPTDLRGETCILLAPHHHPLIVSPRAAAP